MDFKLIKKSEQQDSLDNLSNRCVLDYIRCKQQTPKAHFKSNEELSQLIIKQSNLIGVLLKKVEEQSKSIKNLEHKLEKLVEHTESSKEIEFFPDMIKF